VNATAPRSAPTAGQALDAALAALVPTIAEQVAALLLERTGSVPQSGSPWMSVAEAAEYMRCKPKRLYDLAGQSRVPAHKDGSRLLFHRDELDAYLCAADTLLTPPRSAPSNGARRTAVRIVNPAVAGEDTA
jgi:excisionase family DNA binding protein